MPLVSLVEYSFECSGIVPIKRLTAKYNLKNNQKVFTDENIEIVTTEVTNITRALFNGKVDENNDNKHR